MNNIMTTLDNMQSVKPIIIILLTVPKVHEEKPHIPVYVYYCFSHTTCTDAKLTATA